METRRKSKMNTSAQSGEIVSAATSTPPVNREVVQECVICATPFNKSNRVKLACLYCGFEACRACNETYILSETIPKCMNTQCGREWTRKYLTDNFTKTFVSSTYKKHREDVLFDRERSLMPETQIYIGYMNQITELEAEYAETEKILARIYSQRANINARVGQLRQLLTGDGYRSNREISHFIFKCPDEACRGFLSTQWKCGVCEKWTCNQCHEIKGTERDAEHTCNPDNVATAALLARDTKNCPNCHTSIHKIDGCDQMWCTQCHTAFSWRTGRIVENGIHNPHYYEWLRRNGGAGGEARAVIGRNGNCAQHDNRIDDFLRSVWVDDITRKAMNALPTDHPIHIMSFYRMVQNLFHIRDVDRRRYEDVVNGNALCNRKLRIDYMMNRISEDQFKRAVQQLEKKTEKARDYMNVYEILVNTCMDVLGRFCQLFYVRGAGRTQMVDEDFLVLGELIGIIQYVNECLEEISKTYSSVRYFVSPRLTIVKYE